jgi:hypothetical protein
MITTSSSVANTCLKNKRKNILQFPVELSEENFLSKDIILLKFINNIPTICRLTPPDREPQTSPQGISTGPVIG